MWSERNTHPAQASPAGVNPSGAAPEPPLPARAQQGARQWGARLWHFLTAKDERAFTQAVSPLTAGDEVPRDWLRELLFQLRPAYRQVIAMALAVNVIALLTALFSLQVYDRVVAHAGYASLVALVLGMLLAIGIDYVMRNGRALLLQRVGARIEAEIARAVFKRLMHLPTLELEKRNATYWQAVFRDIELVRSTCSGSMALLIVDLPFLLLSLLLIGLIAWPVLPVALLSLLAFMVLAWRSGQGAEQKNAAEKSRMLTRDATIADLAHARVQLKALGAGPAASDRWEQHYAQWMTHSLAHSREGDRYRDLATEMSTLTTVVVTSLGALAILNQLMTMGALIAANILAGKLISPLVQLVAQWRSWGQFLAARQRLDDLFKLELDRQHTAVTLPRPRGALVLDQVSFTYPGGKQAQIVQLAGQIGPGGLHAIVGANGSGKSTLLKLLRGLYPPSEGRITLDGADLAQFSQGDLSRWIGYLPQQVQLIAGTVRDNVALSDTAATDEQVVRASQWAGCHSFVIDLPDGYDTPVGDGGSRFSGGQRKRIAIAQVLLHDPAILLLDEPTSDLDPVAEQQFVAQLKALATDHTIVVVTHSTAVLRQCQGILVMDKGKLVMAGPAAKVLPKLGLSPAQSEVAHAA